MHKDQIINDDSLSVILTALNILQSEYGNNDALRTKIALAKAEVQVYSQKFTSK